MDALLGRVLREAPDHFGADLVMILPESDEVSGKLLRYHVVRVQVKGGTKYSVGLVDLHTFLDADTVKLAKSLHAGILGVEEGGIEMHRLLACGRSVTAGVEALVNPASLARELTPCGRIRTK